MRIFLQISPIVAALRSHKIAVALLVLEIALTMAILGNLVFNVTGSLQRARTPTGIAEDQIGLIQSVAAVGITNTGTAAGNLAVLRNVPGVTESAYAGGAPLLYVEHDPLFLDPSREHAVTQGYHLLGSQGLSRTLGVRLVEGHDFSEDELPDVNAMGNDLRFPVLITAALAKRLFPGGSALGKVFYDGNVNMRVIGVIEHMRAEITGRDEDDFGILREFHVGGQNFGGGYLIRTNSRLKETLAAASAALSKANPGHVQPMVFTMPELREKYFRSDVAVGQMLIAILVILLVLTTLGVAGLASFWVQQRRQQIGVRRALGASRGDILRYFQIENFLIVTVGVVLGIAAAYGLNAILMSRFELPKLPLLYVGVGGVSMWVLGQLAVLGPALKAAAVPPVVATRVA